ncbi:GNAT family N-acetyltransferase [Caldalkalibacillus mannanilyticus]|uniref:GNAT family N-acetyltransferase n=1 Tax=Caldalkalibacillus mannanilyticus TaxID=1418 RepID=UPI00046A7E69|nr:GNAT family N-acetyltransferase [Caldalkalibacillus mannanilyticus]
MELNVTFETERLFFRQYSMADLPFLLTMTRDPDVMKFIGEGRALSEKETVEGLGRFIKSYEDKEHTGLLVAIEKESRSPIGHAGLIKQMIEGKQEIEIGYWLAKEYWGKGYATEAAVGCKEYGLSNLGKKRLVSIIQLENHPSMNVARKNGMQFERTVSFREKEVALYSIG